MHIYFQWVVVVKHIYTEERKSALYDAECEIFRSSFTTRILHIHTMRCEKKRLKHIIRR